MKDFQETTKKFSKLPPRTGIPFEGFEFARVKSRLPVAQQLEGFLDQCSQSTSVNVALIRAEWGEGKTDAYERYLEPKITQAGSHSYLVSTSTIALHVERIKETFPRGGTTAASFLAATFAALRDELRSRHKDNLAFPDYSTQADPLEYADDVIEKHLADSDGRLFVFVDEFEEILNHPDQAQRFVLSGIKELINGQLGAVHSGGKYGGRLHFIIAVTPYAYGRMHDDRELLQIFGSFASRLSTIDLPQIGREEAFDFIMDLVRYSYGGSLPDPLPFRSAGILNSIAAISQRNMRALVQLYVDVMTSAEQKDHVRIIDANNFLDSLASKEIAVYGELRPCIDKDLLTRIESAFRSNKVRGDQCVKLFRLLVGEYKPFGIDEIRDRIGLHTDADVHAVVDLVNQELARHGIPRGIMRLNPSKEGLTPETILGEVAPAGEEILLVANKLPVRVFWDNLVHSDFERNGVFRRTIYLPHDEEDLKDVFDLNDADASFLISKMGRRFEEIARHRFFIISRQLAEQVFPSPTWVLIDFVTDRSKRAELWREATKAFGERLWQLRDLTIEVMNYSSRIHILPDSKAQLHYVTQYNAGGGRTVPIRTHIQTTTGLGESDVREALSAMNSKAANMGILLHTGDIGDEARHLIVSSPKLVTIRIRRARALQLLVLGLARERNLEVGESALEARIRDLFHEFDVEKLMDQWIKRLRNEGLVIDALSTRYGRSDKALADTLAYNINRMNESLTPDEVFESVERLRSFTIYRQNTEFAPIDIETPEELEKYLDDLVSNGFLRVERNKYAVVETPVENRIVKLLGTRPLSAEALQSHFVIFSLNDAILNQVYLPTLERKGLISVGNEVALQELHTVLRLANEAFEKFDSRVATLRQTRWWSYAMLCVSKDRGDRVISIEEFDSTLRELRGSLKPAGSSESGFFLLQRCHLLSALLVHFEQTLAKRVDGALSKGEWYSTNASEKLLDVTGKVSQLVQEYNRYCDGHVYANDDVDELDSLIDLKDQMMKIHETALPKETTKTELDALRKKVRRGEKPHFYFGFEPEMTDYFSLKVKHLRELYETFEAKAMSDGDIADRIERKIRDIDNIKNKAKGRVATYRIDNSYSVASALLAKISEFSSIPVRAEFSAGLTLSLMEQFFDRAYKTLAEFSATIDQGVDLLNDILELERQLVSTLDGLENTSKSITAFFDRGDPISVKAGKLAKSIVEAKNAWTNRILLSTSTTQALKDADQLIEVSRKTLRSLEEVSRRIFPIETELTALKAEIKDILDEYLRNGSYLIRVLAGARAPVSDREKSIEAIVGETWTVIDNLFQGRLAAFTWKKTWEELNEFRDQLYNESEQILSPVEFKVLYSIVSAAGASPWLLFGQLVDRISAQQGMEKPDVEHAIRSLLQKGLLREGVSLAI